MANDELNTTPAKKIVADFLATFSRGDVPGVLQRMHNDGSWWVSGSIEGMSGTYGKDTLGALLEGARAAYRTGALRITPLAMIAEGNTVAVEAESYAELVSGRVYNNHYHFLFELRDGLIFRVREYMDTIHARDTFFG